MLKTMNDKDAELQKEKKKRKVYQRKQKELEKKYKELEARAANLVPGGMGVPLPPGAKYVIIAADGTQGVWNLCFFFFFFLKKSCRNGRSWNSGSHSGGCVGQGNRILGWRWRSSSSASSARWW
jgi:hypothetical protein